MDLTKKMPLKSNNLDKIRVGKKPNSGKNVNEVVEILLKDGLRMQ